jgi:hypothetical protein
MSNVIAPMVLSWRSREQRVRSSQFAESIGLARVPHPDSGELINLRAEASRRRAWAAGLPC